MTSQRARTALVKQARDDIYAAAGRRDRVFAAAAEREARGGRHMLLLSTPSQGRPGHSPPTGSYPTSARPSPAPTSPPVPIPGSSYEQ